MAELSPPRRFVQKHKHHAAVAQKASKVHQVSALSTPAVPQHPQLPAAGTNVPAARTNPRVLGAEDTEGGWHASRMRPWVSALAGSFQ